MRVAIPVTDGQVTPHLGHCQHFLIADVADGHITEQRVIANPGHGPGGPPPVLLAKLGVTQVVAWGVPEHALDILSHLGVKVQLGATGSADQVLRDFLNGTLQLTTEGLDAGGSCSHDQHHDHDQHHAGH